MAITRTQIARQLYKDGKRVGLKPGGPPGGGATSMGSGRDFSGGEVTSDSGFSNSGNNNVRDTGSDYGQFDRITERQRKQDLRDLALRQEEDKAFEQQGFETLRVKDNNFPGFIGMGLNALKGPRQKLLDRNIDFFRNDPRTARAREKYGLTAQGYRDYMSARLAGNIDAAGNIINQDDDDNSIIPFMAQAPSNTDQETEVEEEPFQRNFRLMADGGRAEFAEGGIMPRLSDLSGNVSSAEQMLQQINQRLQSAESTLGEGGGQLTQLPAGGVLNNPDPKYSSFEEAFDAYKDNPIVGKDIASGDLSFKDFSNQMNLSSGAYGMHGAGGVPAGGNFGGFGGYSFNDKTNEITRRPSPQVNMSLGPLQPAMQSPLQTALGLADGGRAALAEGGMPYEGGIMDLESSRQMYGLGKLVKKITRGVKKIAKSPIGKAALLYAGGSYLKGAGFLKSGGPGGMFAKIFGANNTMPGFENLSTAKMSGILGKLGLTKGYGSIMPTALGGILGSTALSYFMTPEEEEQQAMNYGADIDDPRTIMANPSLYTNRRLAAEGGSMDEPVAKKTMPLLDMDGQEMDLRAEGGFVPIGRMEKADDVPARLSKNEFVFTAEAVRNAGEGDVDKGAEVMYNMMKNLESGGEVSEESQGLEGAREMFQTSQRLEEVI